mgnify:CR=1 FL=1
MIQLKTSGSIKDLPSISDEEYTARYIESLSFYQNGEWNKSLDGFTYLIAVNSHEITHPPVFNSKLQSMFFPCFVCAKRA